MCQAVCPVDAVEVTMFRAGFAAQVDQDQCIQCGDCRSVCPGIRIRADLPSSYGVESYLGRVATAWAAESDSQWRSEYSSSGGFVTAFLAFLLESGRVDGVINVALGAGGLRAAQGQLITRATDLLPSAGSVYYPVSLGGALKEALRKGGNFAVVGLPCQIRGLRAWQRLGTGHAKFSVALSLFCGFVPGVHAFEYALHLLGVDSSESLDRLAFRAKRQHQDGLVAIRAGDERFMPRAEFASLLNRCFSGTRCLMCNDMTGEEADISCGDARSELGENKTLVVSRSLDSTGWILAAAEAGYVDLSEPLSPQTVFSTQNRILRYKKETIAPRLRVARLVNRVVPEASTAVYECFSPGPRQVLGVALFYITCTLTQREAIRRHVLPWLPPKILHHHGKIIYDLLVSSREGHHANSA